MNSTSKILRTVAGAILALALVGWLAAGANTGWTRTSVEVRTLDDVTGIEAISYEKRFVPGIELLGLVVILSAGLAGASLFFRGGRPGEVLERDRSLGRSA